MLNGYGPIEEFVCPIKQETKTYFNSGLDREGGKDTTYVSVLPKLKRVLGGLSWSKLIQYGTDKLEIHYEPRFFYDPIKDIVKDYKPYDPTLVGYDN